MRKAPACNHNSGSTIIWPLPDAAAAATDSLVELIAADMARRWREGQRPWAEEYLVLHPQLWNQPEKALELIYEELCLCDEYGEKMVSADVILRFPQWEEQVRILFACRQIWRVKPSITQLPEVGDSLGDFRFLAELGRGLQGRVYLASQPSLADRPVVVKLTPLAGGGSIFPSRACNIRTLCRSILRKIFLCTTCALCACHFSAAQRWIDSSRQ